MSSKSDRDYNKNARYSVLDKLFRKGTYTKAELSNILLTKYNMPISEATMNRDISYFLGLPGCPLNETLSGKGNERQYTYDNPRYSIHNIPLTEEETIALEQSLLALDRFQFTSQFGWLSPILATLRDRFRLSCESEEDYYIDIDSNDQYSGASMIGDVYKFISSHTVVRVKYSSFFSTKKVWVIHPYLLKQYNNRWFLFAWNHNLNKLSVLALDRIIRIEKNEDPEIEFRENDIDFTHYFDDIIGVTKLENEPVQRVVLRFSPQRFMYIATKPIHSSQKEVEDLDNTISINVRWNRELDSTIMYYGNQVEVLEPQSLRDHIKAKVAKMASRYNIIKS